MKSNNLKAFGAAAVHQDLGEEETADTLKASRII
jgi:hypothetical protein